jgi:hypothetical protein
MHTCYYSSTNEYLNLLVLLLLSKQSDYAWKIVLQESLKVGEEMA